MFVKSMVKMFLVILLISISFLGNTVYAVQISGTVTDSSGNQLENVCINAFTDTCYNGEAGGTNSDAQGHYSIFVPAAGDYYVEAQPHCNPSLSLLEEWYDGGNGTYDCNSATQLAVTSGNDRTGINFVLDPAQTISGRVIDEQGNGIADIDVNANEGKCGAPGFSAGCRTDANGDYTINVPVSIGSFYVQVYTGNATGDYLGGSWNGTKLVEDCNSAFLVSGNSTLNLTLKKGGVISGTVTVSGGGTFENVCVRVSTGKCCQNCIGDAHTDASGNYRIVVPAGDYYVEAYPDCNPSLSLLEEWYDGGNGTYDCNSATQLAVTSGNDRTGINFVLDPAQTISGRVIDEQGNGIADIDVNANEGKCGAPGFSAGCRTDANGDYTINVPVSIGSFYVQVYTGNATGDYLGGSWNGTKLVEDCNSAVLVSGNSTLNLTLKKGEVISGSVTDTGGTPLENVCVSVSTGKCCQGCIGGTHTDNQGNYRLLVAVAGNYYVVAQPHCNSSLTLLEEWYNGGSGTYDCNSATQVTVTAGTECGGIDFSLDPAQTISGRVVDEQGNGIADIDVNANEAQCGGSGFGTGTRTDFGGNYTLNVPAGNFYLYVYAGNSTGGYLNGWWNGTKLVEDCNSAVLVSGNSTLNITLKKGEIISGTVTDTGGTLLENVCVNISTGKCCQNCIGDAHTDAQGNYRITVPGPGDYYVVAQPHCNPSLSLLEVWYDGIYDCNNATPVTVTSGNDRTGINFVLSAATTVSGNVKDTHNQPLEHVGIEFYANQCSTGGSTATAISDADGNYAANVPPGSYYVHTDVNYNAREWHQEPYPVLNEWYNGAAGTQNCSEAALLAANNNRTGINFVLDDVPDYPAPSIQASGVISRERPDGSIGMLFFLWLSGPCPEHLVTCKVVGPSGISYNLLSSNTYERQRGLVYVRTTGEIGVNGTYTFTITDTKGRTVQKDHEFQYNSTVPRIDEASILPADQAYVGTTTPTLSYNSVGPNYYYKVYIIDYDGTSIWFSNDVTQDTSVKVPEGVLQPNTPYKWFARVYEASLIGGKGVSNSQETALRTFYTGTRDEQSGNLVPNLDECYVANFDKGSYSGAWFGVRNTNIAPWDLASLKVTAPDGSYQLDKRDYNYTRPLTYTKVAYPRTLPNGDYEFRLETTSGQTITKTVSFTKNSLPQFDNGGEFMPTDGYKTSYINSDTITFNWPPLANPDNRDLYYIVRIYSHDGDHGNIKWYYSEPVTGNSAIVRVAGNLAVGSSYYWDVFAMDASDIGNADNMSFSDKHCFTVAYRDMAADFSATPVSGMAPLKVSFKDRVQGNVIYWNWDFNNDGVIDSTERNPIHTYDNPGSYTVSLTAGDNYSDISDAESKDKYIVVADPLQPPVAIFSATPLTSGVGSIEEPFTVNFTDQSTGDIESWLWDFGDGATSAVQNPTHAYTVAGDYTVALTVTGKDSSSNSEEKVDLVSVSEPAEPPVAEFSASTVSVVVPGIVDFSDESAGEATSWQWDFGDGIISGERNPSHRYTTAGVYSVALTVSGPGGDDVKFKEQYITVSDPVFSPIARFSAEPTNGVAPQNVTFSDESTGEINTWQWDFGDGASSDAQNPVHIYTVSGTYGVTLTVTGDGGSNTKTETNYIVIAEPIAPPVADFTADKCYGVITTTNRSHNVTFNDLSTGDIETWNWNFGDGSSVSTAKNPTHIYDRAGEFEVTLTVTGSGGSDGETKSRYIIVAIDEEPPTAIVTNPPSARTNQSYFEFIIGGDEVVAYQYQLDDRAISAVRAVSEPCTLAFGLFEDGQHSLRVYGCDSVGNWQHEPTTVTWTIDRIAPTAKLNGAPQGIVGVDYIKVMVGGVDEDVAFYRYKLNDGGWSPAINDDMQIEASGLADGDYTLSVIGSDDLGNWQAEVDATTVNWEVDTSVPTATLENLPPAISNITECEISVSGGGVETYRYRINGGDWSAETDVTNSISFSAAVDDGYTLEVIGKNAAGTEQAEASATTYSWIVDTTASAANGDISLSGGAPPTTEVKLTWMPVEDGLQEYQVRIAQDSWIDWESALVVNCNKVPGPCDGVFTEQLEIGNLLPDTMYHVAIRSVDKAGNISDVSNVATLTTLENLPNIHAFGLINGGGHEGDNSINRPLEVRGENFKLGTANRVRFINVDGTVVIEKTCSVATATALTVEVPAGMPVGDYELKVINVNGESSPSDGSYRVLPAQMPVPEVTYLDPPTLPVGNSATITVNGANFIHGSDVPSTVSLISETGEEISLEFTLDNSNPANTLTATVPAAAPVGIYDVRVMLVDRFNETSNVKLEIYQPVQVEEATGLIEISGGIDLADEGDLAGTIPVEVTLLSENGGGTASANDNCVEIEANFDPGTEILADGQPYTGAIDPPRQIPTTEEIAGELGEDAVVFAMGNPEEGLNLAEGQSIMVTFNAVVETGGDVPTIYYLEADGSFSIAGINGVKDGQEFAVGGTVLGFVNNSPAPGFTNYTIGVLLDHMSTYAITSGPTGSVTINSIGSNDGGVTIYISGAGFVAGMTVTFNGNPATSVVADLSGNLITCVPPPGLVPGATVNVVLSYPGNGGQAATLSFVYLDEEPIPTLNEWGMILFGVLLSLATLVMLRRREID